MGLPAPAELEEGSWLVEGRLASSDGWKGSSDSPWDTDSSEASTLALTHRETERETHMIKADENSCAWLLQVCEMG